MRFGSIASPRSEWDELFNRFFTEPSHTWAGTHQVPTDVFHTEDSLVIRMDLPGVSPDDVDVTVQESTLIVNGKRSFPHAANDVRFLRRAARFGAPDRDRQDQAGEHDEVALHRADIEPRELPAQAPLRGGTGDRLLRGGRRGHVSGEAAHARPARQRRLRRRGGPVLGPHRQRAGLRGELLRPRVAGR